MNDEGTSPEHHGGQEAVSVMVMLVDDQTIIAEAVSQALHEEEGIDFHYCPDGRLALEVAQQLRPSLILQDLVMPGVDGMDLLTAYRECPVLENVPVIVLSVREDPVVKSQAFSHGANDYLVKLPDRVELIARIRYHTRAYRAICERDEALRALRESQRQLSEANLELQQMMRTDSLTGVANRRHFDESLRAEWQRAVRTHAPISLLMIDVDHFKAFNDHFGHVAGDKTLRQVAACIADVCSRPADLPARYGGEEFAVVLPGTSPGGAQLIAEKVRWAVEALAIPHGKAVEGGAVVTVSIGVATMTPERDSSHLELVEVADAMLYEAKQAGRNRVAVAKPGA